MLKVGIGMLVILAFCIGASAETFWVLGSYSNKSNAFAEQTRLSSLLSAEVLVVANPVAETFRVIVDASDVDREALATADVDFWLVNLEVAADTDAETISPAALAPVLPSFEPDESLSAYCNRVEPRPVYCDPENIARLEEKRTMLIEVSGQLVSKCESVTDDRERAICDAWQRDRDRAMIDGRAP